MLSSQNEGEIHVQTKMGVWRWYSLLRQHLQSKVIEFKSKNETTLSGGSH